MIGQRTPINSTEDEHHQAVILLADMVNYSRNISALPLEEIRSFMLRYHSTMRQIIHSVTGNEKEAAVSPTFEPTGGDGTVAIYNCFEEKEKRTAATRVVDTAVAIARAIADGKLEATRLGLFSGKMLEALFEGHTLRFSLAFSAAKRLESLCEYFAVPFLMGEEIATLQKNHSKNVVAIGRITPRHFDYAINIYSIYKAGLHPIPSGADSDLLQRFIIRKNTAVTTLTGNPKLHIAPDFPAAALHLQAAQEIFYEISGTRDTATDRLLQYIKKNPLPGNSFMQNGMQILERRHLLVDQRPDAK